MQPEDYKRYAQYLRYGGNLPLDQWARGLGQSTYWGQLRQERDLAPPQQQIPLSQIEHGQYMRELGIDHPLAATIAGWTLPPLYYAAKKTGVMSGRTDPSWDQMAAGYQGLLEGIVQGWTDKR